jgi:hypothetical protein
MNSMSETERALLASDRWEFTCRVFLGGVCLGCIVLIILLAGA